MLIKVNVKNIVSEDTNDTIYRVAFCEDFREFISPFLCFKEFKDNGERYAIKNGVLPLLHDTSIRFLCHIANVQNYERGYFDIAVSEDIDYVVRYMCGIVEKLQCFKQSVHIEITLKDGGAGDGNN